MTHPRIILPNEEAVIARSLLVPARVPMAETFLRREGVNVYRCPACGNVFRHDDEFEPVCTGPGATDTHRPAVMQLVRVAPAKRQW